MVTSAAEPRRGDRTHARVRGWLVRGKPVAALFAFGLLLRLLFQVATPDGGPCWHIGFQGDAPVWQDLAGLYAHGMSDPELRLPWRPPGMTWSMIFLWDGEGATVGPLRLSFVVLGAAIAPLFWLLLRRRVPTGVAWLAAVFCAGSSNLMLLSSGLHAETPYLFLVLLSFFDQQRLAERPSWFVALRWGVLHGLLGLLRAEHVVAFAALLLVARVAGAPWRTLALALVAAAVPLVPWQLHANRLVAQFNAGEPPLPPSAIPWDDDALAAVRRLPSFQQEPTWRFVTETVRVRGRDRVHVGDLDVVRQAYGVFPEPLQPKFLALQGGFDFWIANTPEAADGFSRAALDRPPPLEGGAQLYPARLLAAAPSGGRFSLSYPPHVHAFVHGYRLGFAEILADPAAASARIAGKLRHALAGATGGLGGHALPIGLSGERLPVDMVVATGIWAATWRVLLLAAALFGLWRLRRVRLSWALWAFAIARFAVIAAYYGYARFGALCVPLVALGVAAVVHAALGRLWRGDADRAALWLGAVLMVLLSALEIVRVDTVAAAVDGRPWIRAAGGVAEYRPHVITFGPRRD